MTILTAFSVLVAATVITTWFNDHVSKAEYIADE